MKCAIQINMPMPMQCWLACLIWHLMCSGMQIHWLYTDDVTVTWPITVWTKKLWLTVKVYYLDATFRSGDWTARTNLTHGIRKANRSSGTNRNSVSHLCMFLENDFTNGRDTQWLWTEFQTITPHSEKDYCVCTTSPGGSPRSYRWSHLCCLWCWRGVRSTVACFSKKTS